MRWWSLLGTAVTLVLSLCMFIDYYQRRRRPVPAPTRRADARSLAGPSEPTAPTGEADPPAQPTTGSARYAVDPALQHRLLPRRRRHQHAADPADDAAQLPGDDRQLEHREATSAATASCSCCWKPACSARSWRWTSSCSTSSGKSCCCRCTSSSASGAGRAGSTRPSSSSCTPCSAASSS